MTNPDPIDVDQFKLMKHRKRSMIRASVYLGIPLIGAIAVYNLIKGDTFMALLTWSLFLIVNFLGLVIRKRTDEKLEYRIYSILFRLFIALVGTAIIYKIGFQSSFSRIGWCYLYPLLVFFAVGLTEGVIWISIFYGILTFFILHFDLQRITLFELQELKYRFLISFSVICMLSIFLEHGFRHAQEKLLNHQRHLEESENRYRQAYEQLNTQPDRKRHQVPEQRTAPRSHLGQPKRQWVDLLRKGQRHWDCPGVLRAHLRHLSAASQPRRICRHWHRVGDLQEDCGSARRAHLGEFRGWKGGHFLLHPPSR
jgi:hypothetical protein